MGTSSLTTNLNITMRAELADHAAWLRNADGGKRLDLSGRRLRGVLMDADITGACLAGADLSGTVFERCCLDTADAAGANLQRVVFRDSFARCADFSHADLTEATLAKSNFMNASFKNALLNGILNIDSSMEGANLLGASMHNARLAGDASLNGVDLLGVDTVGTSRLPDVHVPPVPDVEM